MLKLVNEWFELTVKQIWLKCIERAVNKYNRLNRKAGVQAHVAKKLMEWYNEIYGEEIKLKQEDRQ